MREKILPDEQKCNRLTGGEINCQVNAKHQTPYTVLPTDINKLFPCCTNNGSMCHRYFVTPEMKTQSRKYTKISRISSSCGPRNKNYRACSGKKLKRINEI